MSERKKKNFWFFTSYAYIFFCKCPFMCGMWKTFQRGYMIFHEHQWKKKFREQLGWEVKRLQEAPLRQLKMTRLNENLHRHEEQLLAVFASPGSALACSLASCSASPWSRHAEILTLATLPNCPVGRRHIHSVQLVLPVCCQCNISETWSLQARAGERLRSCQGAGLSSFTFKMIIVSLSLSCLLLESGSRHLRQRLCVLYGVFIAYWQGHKQHAGWAPWSGLTASTG